MVKRTFWILGYGKFGQMAMKKIKQQKSIKSDLIIVDYNPSIPNISGVTTKCCEAIDWLCSAMEQRLRADWIIPTVPLHVIREFLFKKLTPNYSVEILPIPNWLIDNSPNGFITRPGQMTLSNAFWICPDNCSQLESICTQTKQPRRLEIFKFFKELDLEEYEMITLESKQLFPGVGGYKPEDLDLLMNKVISHLGSTFMISTSCKCHGIVDLMKIY